MKRKELTIKQMKFVKEYVNSGNGTQAALKVYDTKTPETAHSIANQNLRKLPVKESIEEVLNRRGLTTDTITTPVSRILFTEEVKTTATDVLRAAEMLYKLHGAYPANKSAKLNLNLSGSFEGLKYQELVQELRNTQDSTKKLLEDLGTK